MARYYRRRYTRTIVRAPRKKWGSNMVNVNMNALDTTGVETLAASVVLAENKTETTAPTPVIIKAGNFRLQGDLHLIGGSSGKTVTITLYIIFVPQGISFTSATSYSNFIQNHPEWIMAWRVLEGGYIPSTGESFDSNRFTVSSRLKRNLNSGDGIYAVLIVENTEQGVSLNLTGKCQFWTCAN